MNSAKNVIEFYTLCNSLKDTIRTGWKDWNVQRERLESVAEHVYGTQMLAIVMASEYHYNLDIRKVVMMLAIHELEEIYIGDLTQFQISKEEKIKLGHAAIEKLLSNLTNKGFIKSLILEFDEGKTPEAQFAFFCDKLECDIQSKLYDEEGCVDLNNQQNNKTFFNPFVQKLLEEEKSFSNMWLRFGQEKYNYDKHFMEVSNYTKQNNLRGVKQ